MVKGNKNTATLSPKAQEVIELALSLNKAADIDEILLDLAIRVTEISAAEATTIYAIDPATNELYSKVKIKEDVREIRLPIANSSVAGYSAANGKIVNLANAYDSEELKNYPGMKFDETWDKMSGFKTRSVLCVPLRFKDTGLQGVIQVINHTRGKTFSKSAENLLVQLARSVAVAFYNQNRMFKEPSRFDLLLEREIITPEQLEKARKQAKINRDHPIRGDVVSVLLNDFGVSRYMMSQSLSQYYQVEVFEFRENTKQIWDLIDKLDVPIRYLSLNNWVPIDRNEDSITIVTDDPNDVVKVTEIINVVNRRGFDGRCEFVVGFREDIKKFLDPDFIPDIDPLVRAKEILDEQDAGIEYDENAPTIVRMVNDLIKQAINSGCSDIHIEPYQDDQPTAVRFRLDGLCHKHSEIRRQFSRAVINRFKILSNLKLDERRMPQSGKIKLKYHDEDIELRVEVTPTYGEQEDVVLRILTSSRPLTMDSLNFSTENFENTIKLIEKPYGIILAVGPTGSGKTTTLHSFLSYLNNPDKKIWTVEDPVEITQKGLRQVQVNPFIKPKPYDFATAMRSFLRADPDIIMVGEMRDRETAAIALQASLTGHLVLTTLHTNSAPETISRIIEMGMDPINISDAILGILAQRLVRTLCGKCKEKYHPDENEIRELVTEYGVEYAGELGLTRKSVLYRAKGCPKCNDSGYWGRTGIHELMVGSPAIKKLIRDRASVSDIRKHALYEGMRTLKMDGIQKILQGQTDLYQVLKVCID